MKSKFFAVLVALVLAAGLSGCFQVDEEIWHNQDGSGRFRLDVGLSEDVLSFLNSNAGEGGKTMSDSWKALNDAPKNNPNIKNAKLDEFAKDGMHHFTADFDLTSIEKSNATSAGGSDSGLGNFKIEKLANGNYRFSQTLGISDGGQSPQDDQSRAMMVAAMQDRYWTVKLHTSKVVASDKAATVDAKTGLVAWKLPMAQLMDGKTTVEIWAEYKAQPELPILLIAGAVGLVLLAAGAGAFVMLKKKHKQAPTAEEASVEAV